MLPVRQLHRRAVSEHHHEVGVRGGQTGHQGRLVGGQIQVDPVEPFRLVRVGQTEKAITVEARRASATASAASSASVVVVPMPNPGANTTLTRLAPLPGARPGRCLLGRVDLGAAGALVSGVRANSPITATVSPADGRKGSRPPSFFNRTAHSAATARARVWWTSTSKPGWAAASSPTSAPLCARSTSCSTPSHGPVDDGLVEFAGPNGGDDRRVADSEVRRHLQVQPGGKGGNPVVHRSPVRHHEPSNPTRRAAAR